MGIFQLDCLVCIYIDIYVIINLSVNVFIYIYIQGRHFSFFLGAARKTGERSEQNVRGNCNSRGILKQ